MSANSYEEPEEADMPAITVENLLVLPRVARPDAATADRPVERVVTAHRQLEGAGFEIWRPFPGELSFEDADPFVLLDARVTKFFTVGQENRKLGVFAEFFNLFNTANFGQTYNGNGRSASFEQPIGFIPGSGYPFQVQLGVRFDF